MAAPTVPVTISFSVPPLPDNAIWFANSAAWSNYWNNSGQTINIPIATPTSYGVTTQGSTAVYTDSGYSGDTIFNLTYNGITYAIVLQAGYDSLVTRVATLVANYQNLKAALIAAGIISL